MGVALLHAVLFSNKAYSNKAYSNKAYVAKFVSSQYLADEHHTAMDSVPLRPSVPHTLRCLISSQ